MNLFELARLAHIVVGAQAMAGGVVAAAGRTA